MNKNNTCINADSAVFGHNKGETCQVGCSMANDSTCDVTQYSEIEVKYDNPVVLWWRGSVYH